MGITRLAITRPIAVLMLVAAFVILGLISYFKLPAELNPKVDFGVISVTTTYAGTNPQEIETLITKPIEDSISGVSGLRQITSNSQQGISQIQCQFYIGSNLDQGAADIRQKVDAVRQRLPRDADSPVISKRDTSAAPIMYIAMKGGDSSRQLRVLADNVVTERLQQAPDVAAIQVFGGDQREIRVGVRQDRLSAYGITIAQLASAISNANSNVAAGYIQTDKTYASIRFLGQFASVDELRDLRLSFPSNSNTANAPPRVVKLGDIANISDTTVQRTESSTIDGQDSVTLAIQKTSDGNTLKAVDGIKKQLEEVKRIVPKNIEFVETADTSKNVRDNLKDVVASLALGALFAIGIVFLFLHNIRATIIVAIAIPTCVIATFLPISAMGFTLNTMTLLGLSLAIGILIDDSIVVLENIVRHLSLGQDPTTAALTGRSEISLAAVTLTAVDLVVFIPIAFMGGVIGEFFRSFGAAISIAVAFSLFVSFTLTPMLASRWFKKGESLESDGEGQRGFFAAFNRGYGRFQNRYRRVLAACLRHPWLVVMTGTIALVIVLGLVFPKLGFRFAPGQDQNQVSVTIEGPAGVSLAYTQNIAKEVERRIRAADDLKGDVKYLLTSVGQSQSTGGNEGTQYANIDVELFDKISLLDKLPWAKHTETLRNEADADVAKRIRKLVQSIPGAKIQSFEVNGFGGGGPPLTIDVVGTDFNQLLKTADTIKGIISKQPGVYNPDITFKASQPEVQIRLDRLRAAQYGLTVQEVSQAVSTAFQGDISSKYRDPSDNEEYNIRVQLADINRNSVYEVGSIPVSYQNGNPIVLRDVANITFGAGPTRVDRLDRERKVSVTGYLLPGFQIGNIQQKLDPSLKKLQASGAFGTANYRWGGEAQTIGEEGPYLLQAVFLGVILSYMLMAALFNNMLYPLSVMLTLPQALVGALVALYLTSTPFSLIAAIGVIMLNGLAAKNAILMVDYTNTLRARGYKRLDAILTAAPTRLRPILMTSSAIICATLPTAMALGRGAGFRQSLGIVVVGGVIVSTVLTLIVIPCVYLLFDNFSNWLGRIGRGRPAQSQLSTVAYADASNGSHGSNGFHDDHQDGNENGKGRNGNGNGRGKSVPIDEEETEPLD